MSTPQSVQDDLREPIGMLLLRAEKTLSQHGWDQPPVLTMIDTDESGALVLVRLPLAIPGNPGPFLAYVADTFAESPVIAELATPGFRGVAFCAEGWAGPQMSADEVRQLRRSGRSLADIVGSQETRMINAVDIHGNVYLVSRARGETPQLFCDKQKDPQIGGGVSEQLRRITLAIVRHLADNEQYVKALQASLIPTTDEFLSAHRSPNE